MQESQVEKYLHQQIVKLGGTTRKWVSPNHTGVPDRICFLPAGRILFVEVKSSTGRTTVRQEREIQALQGMGCECHVVYGKEGVDILIENLTETPLPPQ